MPHIVVEATEFVARHVDLRACLQRIHCTLAEQKLGNLGDFKSRVITSEQWVVADGRPDSEVVFATLYTMNPRPESALIEMGKIIHTLLLQAMNDALPQPRWAQCCVRIHNTPSQLYFKSSENAPAEFQARFQYVEQPAS